MARERVKERLGESEETEPDDGARGALDPFDDAFQQVKLGRELSGQSRRAADELSGYETGGLDPVSENVTRTVHSERHAYLVQRLNKVFKDSCPCLAHHIDQGFDSGGLEQGSLDASRLFLKPAARFVSDMASHALGAKGDAPSCDGFQSRVDPERVFQQLDVEGDAVVGPQSAGARKVSATQESAYRGASLPSAARSAGVREIAEDRECKLLEGRVVADNLLQERDDPRCSCCILSRLAQAAKIEQRVDSGVLKLLRAGASVDTDYNTHKERAQDVLPPICPTPWE